MANGMESRKAKHIDVCLTEAVDYQTVTTGLERFRLPYNALTQTSLGAVDLGTDFLGVRLAAPVLIGAMTGGAELSGVINRNLAAAAQKLGIGMMLGSQRIMLDDDFASASFTVRDVAPDALLIGNIGLAQLSDELVPELVDALDRVGANALAVHTNPLQEAMQHEGDTDFSGSVARLRDVARSINYPVMLKEVGHGIGAAAAAELVDCPIAAVDVAGAGGTSWARVEQFVRYGEIRYPGAGRVGHPDRAGAAGGAPDAARRVAGRLRRHPHRHGRRQGAGDGRRRRGGGPPAAGAAIESTAAVLDWLQRFIAELQICLHGCGAANLAALRRRGVTPIP